MRVQQRDIVELNYELPNGKFKTHPALIISKISVLKQASFDNVIKRIFETVFSSQT